MLSFYRITMLTKDNRKLCLSMWSGSPKWSFDFSEACYFDNETQAYNYAVSWFLNFKNWKVEEVNVDPHNVERSE